VSERRQRANGRASRAAILDAAAQVAGERGYEGTRISLVSERSGLPASSIYWHFKNKDELIAAVIDRSYTDWVEAITTVPELPAGVDPNTALVQSMRHAGEQITKYPDFLRLGLMLVLEQRPDEPSARQRFHDARRETLDRLGMLYRPFFAGLTDADIDRLAVITLAGSDGIFVAAVTEAVDIPDHFETLALAVLGAARALGWTGVPTS
jgi:AcrR family transcriptional regulator